MKLITKHLSLITLLMLVSVLFMGCPYSSEVPIDKPSVKLDGNLIGTWVTDNESDSTKYTVSKMDDFTYNIEKKSTSSNETTVTKYKGYLSDIGGTKFMNVWADDGSTTAKYYFYKIEWADDNKKFIMHEITDNITETYASSDELKKFIQANMGLSFFFNKDKYNYLKK